MVRQLKYLLFIGICFFSEHIYSQSITKYFDSNWVTASKEKAVYYTNFVKDGELYHCTSYWIDSNQLYAKSTYSDTNFTKGIGIETKYYKSGRISDSIFFADNGNLLFYDHYTENGKPEFHAFYDEKEQYMKAEQFDENGNKLPGYITFQKQAMFPGGSDGWRNYLQTHLKADVPMRKKAPDGNYTVTVSFLIDKLGKISEVKAENDPGYGTAEEAIRVIKNGPAWIPAVQNNKPVIYRQKQSITFHVTTK